MTLVVSLIQPCSAWRLSLEQPTHPKISLRIADALADRTVETITTGRTVHFQHNGIESLALDDIGRILAEPLYGGETKGYYTANRGGSLRLRKPDGHINIWPQRRMDDSWIWVVNVKMPNSTQAWAHL
jgi:hypothetical protein